MKRIGNLYERVCEPDNIYLAYTKARKGKTKSYGVVQFEKELERNLEEIHEKLKDGSSGLPNIRHFLYMIRKNGKYIVCHLRIGSYNMPS